LTSKKSLSLAEFCAQPLVLFHEGYYLRDAVGQYAKKNNLNLDIRMETNLIELQKALVKSQVGITSCLSMILDNDDDLISIPFTPKINLKLGLAWKQNQRLSKAAKVLAEYLQNQQDK
jgi:DNA-binding transcriptional LysR family regulator